MVPVYFLFSAESASGGQKRTATADAGDQSDIQLVSRTVQLLSIWQQRPQVTLNAPSGSNKTKAAERVRRTCQGFR